MVVEDLNRMAPELIDEMRTMQPAQRQMFFWRVVSPENRAYATKFISDVVDGGVPAEDWARGCVVVPELPVRELLGLSAEQILEPLSVTGDAVRARVAFAGSAQAPSPYGGAPAAEFAEADYRWSPPRRGAIKIATGAVELLPITRPDVAVRRWVTYRFAVAFAGEPQPEGLSSDGRKVLSALAREAEEFGGEGVPGFRGPDEWFE
ncbi:hypothetical protein [Actinoplanes aureus]|uniref:Uncharacterized protein n=1 Tax=Actinoplanes aureus TaxID=2792083 RepID=A0A931FXM9_9ACTN|nr:hypothetical protein [Actinoplanes aureus]MBG0562872.1 hypothetical protein [Actinoplanes aureus]